MQDASMSDEEIIDDAFVRAFVMLLGVNPPRGEVKNKFIRFTLNLAAKRGTHVDEEFVFACIPSFIIYLNDRG